jgi:hypothetical protein
LKKGNNSDPGFKQLHRYLTRCVLITTLFVSRIVLAPFFYVGFADFWLADQLNSLGQAVKDFKYLGRQTLSPLLGFS